MGLTSRTLRAVLTLLVTAALSAACGGQKAAQDPPATHTSSPTAPDSPSAPVLPALATEHTEAGAKAFVSYYWDTVNYARANLDESVLAPLVDDNCKGCSGIRQSIINDRGQGARVKGGANHLASATATMVGVAGERKPWGANLECVVDSDPEVLDFPGRASDKSYPAQSHRVAMTLVIHGDGWVIDRLDPR